MRRPSDARAATPLRAALYIVLCALCALSPLCAALFPAPLVDAVLRAALFVFLPLAAFCLAAFFAYAGLHPLFACLPPGVCYLLLSPVLGMRPMAGLAAALFGLSLLAACGGQELRRRKRPRAKANRRRS